MRVILVAAALVATPFTAVAAQDQVAFEAISNANYTVAEQQLAPQVAAGEREPGVLLNLAAVYARTGRSDEAARLYRIVQAEENVLMDPAAGDPVWSHDVARHGLMLARR